MSRTEKTRTFHFEVPSTIVIPWQFEFSVLFVQRVANRVTISWRERAGSSGTFYVQDCGITWKALLAAWRACSQEAYWLAQTWNEMDS